MSLTPSLFLRQGFRPALFLVLAACLGPHLLAAEALDWSKGSRIINSTSEERVTFMVEAQAGQGTIGEVWIKKENANEKEVQLDTRTSDFRIKKDEPYLVLFKTTTDSAHKLDVTLKVGDGEGETRVRVFRDQSNGGGDSVTLSCKELKKSKVAIDLSGFRDTKGGTFLVVN